MTPKRRGRSPSATPEQDPVGEIDDVPQLLDQLCVDLGFCLSPDARKRLIDRPPSTIDAFTDAVFEAEGFDLIYGHIDKKLHAEVRKRIVRHVGPFEGPVDP